MAISSKLNTKVEEVLRGERSLLQEAHELVINEEFPDLPEALAFITDQEHHESLMHALIENECYEECGQLLRDKCTILSTMHEDD